MWYWIFHYLPNFFIAFFISQTHTRTNARAHLYTYIQHIHTQAHICMYAPSFLNKYCIYTWDKHTNNIFHTHTRTHAPKCILRPPLGDEGAIYLPQPGTHKMEHYPPGRDTTPLHQSPSRRDSGKLHVSQIAAPTLYKHEKVHWSKRASLLNRRNITWNTTVPGFVTSSFNAWQRTATLT